MEYNYPENTNNCSVTYMRTREGPNHFRVFYKNAAQIRYTPKEVGAIFGVARFTPSVNKIRDWCYEQVNKFGSETDKTDENYLKYIAKHGFGPEVHDKEENDVYDGTKDTKMVM